jgi:arginine utilization regulatory protein
MTDLPLLMNAFVKNANRTMNKKVKEASPQVISLFNRHNWPGNVRELQHAIEHAMNYAEDNTKTLEFRHIPHHLLQKYNADGRDLKTLLQSAQDNSSLKEMLQRIEKEIINKTLEDNDRNITKAARALGMSRQNLQQRLKRLAIN